MRQEPVVNERIVMYTAGRGSQERQKHNVERRSKDSQASKDARPSLCVTHFP